LGKEDTKSAYNGVLDGVTGVGAGLAMVRQVSDAVVEDRLEIIEASEMRHRCLLGSQGKPTVAKSGAIGNLKLPANSKLELLDRFHNSTVLLAC